MHVLRYIKSYNFWGPFLRRRTGQGNLILKKHLKILGVLKNFKDFVTIKGVENFQILILQCVSELVWGMCYVGKVDDFYLAK